MGTPDWLRVIAEAVDLGVKAVQFIGGEPTRHPDLATLVLHAVDRDLHVEIFSNLVHIRPALWELFSCPGVSPSYDSDDPSQHEAITGLPGSYAKTRANLAEAVKRAIPLRVGVIEWIENSVGGELLPNWTSLVWLLSMGTTCVSLVEVHEACDRIWINCVGDASTASRRYHR